MIKASVLYLLICASHLMTGVSRPVVHLDPNHARIPLSFDGDMLELVNSPSTVLLPPDPPKPNSEGAPWTIYVKNLGPAAVTVEDLSRFHLPIGVGQTVEIISDGSLYAVKR